MRFALAVAAAALAPALAAAQPYAFVSTPADGTLTRIDLATQAVQGTIPLAGLPTGCAVGEGGRVYAALTEANALAIVGVRQGAIRTVPVGSRPSGVAIGLWGKVYVANTGSDTVSVVDPVRGRVTATIPVGDGPTAVVAAGRRVYVANWNGRSVSVIDAALNRVAATIGVGAFPAGLALHENTQRLYVANFFDDTVSVVDTAALAVVSTVPVARRPRGLAVDASGGRLYVASFDDSLVQVVDTAAATVIAQAGSGGQNPLDLMLAPGGARLYVAHVQNAAGVAVLDAATLAPVTTVAVSAGPLAFAGRATFGPSMPLPATWRLLGGPASDAVRARKGTASDAGDTAPFAPSDYDLVLFDGEFPFGDWQGNGIANQMATGGNPGAWRRMQHFGAANESTHLLVRQGASYTPSQAGPIIGLDVSWDRRLLSEVGLAFEAFVVNQDGVSYRTDERGFESPAWQADSRTGLMAADFDDGQGHHPDFGESGGRIFFGYSRRTEPNQSIDHGIDNFKVTIHSGGATAAGRLAFEQTTGLVPENDISTTFNVQRLSSAIGAVGVDVNGLDPDPSTLTLDWPDAQSGNRGFYVSESLSGGAKTFRYRLANATGGAQIDPTRDLLAVTVYPDTWAPQLVDVFLRLGPFLSAFSPAWLLLLAGPALIAARRSWGG